MKSAIKILFYLAVLFVVSISTWYISEQFRAPGEQLMGIYEKNFRPCLNYWTTDPNYVDSTGLSQIAMKYYEKGEYSLAIEGFQNIEPRAEEEGYYNLYLGISYLKTGFDNLAINSLELAVKNFKEFNNVHLGKWYLSLAFLKAGRDKEALEGLNDIVRLNAKQKTQAVQIIKDVEVAKNPLRGIVNSITE